MRAKFIVLAAFGAAAALTCPASAQDDGYGYRFHNEDGGSGLSGVFGLRGSFAFAGQVSGTVAGAPRRGFILPTTMAAAALSMSVRACPWA